MHGHLGSLVKPDVVSSGCNQIHKGCPRDVQHNAAILLMPQCKVGKVDKKTPKKMSCEQMFRFNVVLNSSELR